MRFEDHLNFYTIRSYEMDGFAPIWAHPTQWPKMRFEDPLKFDTVRSYEIDGFGPTWGPADTMAQKDLGGPSEILQDP